MSPLRIALTSLLLLVVLAGVGLGIGDLKSPKVQTQTCQWVGRGKALGMFGRTARVLYRQSSNVEADMGLMCPDLGPVLMNDVTPLEADPSHPVKLTLKTYRFFPPQVRLAVPLIN